VTTILMLNGIFVAQFFKGHIYHSRFTPEGVAEVSQIFLRDTHVLPKLVNYDEHCRRDRWSTHRRLIDGPWGVVVRILVFYVRGHGFDFRTVQTFVSMNMSVCIILNMCINIYNLKRRR
jgi:hypothetical protein